MNRRARLAASTGLLLAVLAGCSTEPPPAEVDPAPVVNGEPAPRAEDLGSLVLPMPFETFEVVATGWDEVPLERDGTMLGIRSAPSPGDALVLAAFDSEGTVLWEAERPPSCSGFALSRAGERPVAVLTDLVTTEDALAQTIASGYDLVTGERLWGPVDVPGPHQGPGTVFASPAPRAAMGTTGPRVALDPATGATVVAEADRPGTTVVGEYDGVVLTAADGTLAALGPDGEERWTLTFDEAGIPAGLAVAAVAGARPPEGTALVGSAGAGSGSLIDIADGTVLATGIEDARRDALSGTMVTVAGRVVSGLAVDGGEWTRTLADDVRIAAAGGVLAYLRVGDAVHVLNVATGDDAMAYPDGMSGPVALPALVSAHGAAVLALDEHVLVTTRGVQGSP